MIYVTISIGSNCGDRRAMVQEAIDWLKSFLLQVKYSGLYETPCALKEGKPYVNAVLEGFFQGTGFELEEKLKEKEKAMGRSAECRKKGDVPIDMDIVIMDREVIKEWDYRQKFFQLGLQLINT